MVVTKYLFQFGFFPWNSYVVLRRYENKPYFPPRILGLEKTDSYIKYDLVQLMALFFHRSQLLVSPPAGAGAARLPRQPQAFLSPAAQSGLSMLWVRRLTNLYSPQCYGLWDHEEDRVPKDHCRNSEKDQEAEEEAEAKLELQPETGTGHPEEPVSPGAPRDHSQGKGSVRSEDGVHDPPENLKPQNTRNISIRFRRRKETPGPKGTAVVGESPG